MQEFISRVNIERYRRLIAAETDAAQLERLKRMLEDEEARLRAYQRCGEAAPGQGRPEDTIDRQTP